MADFQASGPDNRMVYLCCDDNRKMVVKAKVKALKKFSKYFQEIITLPVFEDSTKEMVFFLKDIPFKDLQILIDFMSNKELEIEEDSIDSLIATAKSLQIEEFLSMIDKHSEASSHVSPTVKDQASKEAMEAPKESLVDSIEEENVFKKQWFAGDSLPDDDRSDIDIDLDQISDQALKLLSTPEVTDEIKDEDDDENPDIDLDQISDQTLKLLSTPEDEIKDEADHQNSESEISSVYFDCSESLSTISNVSYHTAKDEIDLTFDDSKSEKEFQNYKSSPEVQKNDLNENKDDMHFSSLLGAGDAHITLTEEQFKVQFEAPIVNPPFLYLPPLSNTLWQKQPLQEVTNTKGSTQDYKVVQGCKKMKSTPVDSAVTSVKEFGKLKKKSQSFICKICNKEMGWRQSARFHVKQQHPGKDPKDYIKVA